MKRYIIILFSVISSTIISQVKNYQINVSSNIGISAYRIYNSNDGNLLLSNREINLNVGSSHVLKVKPNGDTIFIKSTDAVELFVTSNGNILTNAKDFNIVNQSYSTSYLTMYDRNYNKKWQLDLKDNALYFPNTSSNTFVNGFVITSMFEINTNYYKAFVNTTSSHVGGPFNGKMVFDFDSLGNILSGSTLYYFPLTFDEFINNTKNQVVGFANYHSFNGFPSCEIIRYNIANSTSQSMFFNTTGTIPIFKKGIFINDKMYLVGVLENQNDPNQTYKKAFLACIDGNSHVNWCKTIIPNDSTVNNEFSEMINVNQKIVCKYKSSTSTYILNIDTLGQTLNTYQTDTEITNLVKLNDDIYTSRAKVFSSQSFISLIKMDTLGNYSCAVSASLTLTNYSLSIINIINNGQALSGSLTYSLSNQPYNIYTYTVNLSDDCDLATSINEIGRNRNDLVVYPNPTNDILNITTVNFKDKEGLSIKLHNVLGKEVLTTNYKEEINISNLEKGIYFLSVYQNKQLIGTKKVVKE